MKNKEKDRLAIGQRIRAARRAREMTAQRLAKSAGVSPGYLSEVERGLSSVSVEKLKPIAEELGVGLVYLLEGIDQENEDEEVRIPSALAEAAEQLDLSYSVTRRLLEGRASLVARRSSKTNDEWNVVKWTDFYNQVKDYI